MEKLFGPVLVAYELFVFVQKYVHHRSTISITRAGNIKGCEVVVLAEALAESCGTFVAESVPTHGEQTHSPVAIVKNTRLGNTVLTLICTNEMGHGKSYCAIKMLTYLFWRIVSLSDNIPPSPISLFCSHR